MHGKPYVKLAVMAVLSFASMYLLMYAMVDSRANVYANVNQLYMAGLMTAPMVILELVLMRAMYENRRRNAAIAAVAVGILLACFGMIRRQTGVGDEQFLKSMIPHHAAALLMCRRAPIEDPGIHDLCHRILAGQQAEIDEMKAKLETLE
jgi:uncharacterized protein (DUF305 family)